jgi:hypothetical protein
MKFKLIMILLFITPALLSIETEYDQIIDTEYDAVWELENSQDGTVSAVLDCQSFFHKLDFIHNPSGEVLENFLSFKECEDIYYKVTDCLKTEGYVCIDTDDILDNQCYCKD